MKIRSFLSGLIILFLLLLSVDVPAFPEDLKKLILQKVEEKQVQVVMFGERHEISRLDNDFVAELLPELKKMGFEYLALEHQRGPITEVGFDKAFLDYATGKIRREEISRWSLRHEKIYSPGWFDLVDAARNAGLKIVCYDANPSQYNSFNEREEIAFANLEEMIFRKNPGAKVIVYCGIAHINKNPTRDQIYKNYETENNFLPKDEEYKCLAFHLNAYTRGKVLTVRLLNDDFKLPCDIDLTL